MTRTLLAAVVAALALCAPALADTFDSAAGGPNNGSVIERRLGTSGRTSVPVDETNPLPVSGGGAPTGTAGSPNAAVTSVQGVAGGTPQTVTQSGTTGADFSANAATIPMAGFVLLTTVPATATRAGVEVQNQSAGTVQMVRDDGTGANQTTILISPGAGVGTQGGGWSSNTFKGRVRVYGATGAQVAADQE